jgi:catechol 2,3-dioxygenase-like lactoylglutathione lyase family enzyme
MAPNLGPLDHLVLTVRDMAASVDFYTRVLGMTYAPFRQEGGAERIAVAWGDQKINLHDAAAPLALRAGAATPGAADLCFTTDAPLADWQSHLARAGIEIVEGPVRRAGATGPLNSIYLRDPDANLIEIANRL